MTDVPAKTIRELARSCAAGQIRETKAEVMLGLLTGSQAYGITTEDSDIDVVILCSASEFRKPPTIPLNMEMIADD